jgi:amino acid transporter, AAT family
MLIGVALNYIVPERVFVYVTSISLVGSLWTWALIVIAHLGYRKAVAIGEIRPVAYRMPGSPYTNWFDRALPTKRAGPSPRQFARGSLD